MLWQFYSLSFITRHAYFICITIWTNISILITFARTFKFRHRIFIYTTTFKHFNINLQIKRPLKIIRKISLVKCASRVDLSLFCGVPQGSILGPSVIQLKFIYQQVELFDLNINDYTTLRIYMASNFFFFLVVQEYRSTFFG